MMQNKLSQLYIVGLAFALEVAFTLASSPAVHAQSSVSTSTTTSAMTPVGMSPGSPAGSYALSGFDDVNLGNGNLNFRLPLISIGGRGAAGYTMMLATSTKTWQVKTDPGQDTNGGGGPINDRFTPQRRQWNTLNVGYGAGVMQARSTGVKTLVRRTCDTCPLICPRVQPLYMYTLTRLTFITPDGTEHELRDEATNGQPMLVDDARCFDGGLTGASRGTRFISADGSAMTFVSGAEINDRVVVSPSGNFLFSPSGVLYLRDGTRYVITNGVVTLIQDRNGNRIEISPTLIKDSLGRTITIDYDYNEAPYGLHDRITYRGYSRAARVLRISKTSLSNALRAPYAIRTYPQLFPDLNGAINVFSSLDPPSQDFNPTVVSTVWLPDSRSYKIFYNSYGEVARVELPTGGAFEYDMMPGSGVIVSPGATPSGVEERQIYRRLKERRTYTGLTLDTLESRTVYTAGNGIHLFSDTQVKVEQYDAAEHLLALTMHYFSSSAAESLFTREEGSLYSPAGEGREILTDTIDPGNQTTVLRRIGNTWVQREQVSWVGNLEQRPPNYAPPGLSIQPENNPRLIKVVTTLETNQVSQQEFGYDFYNNQIEVKEFDYGAEPGTPGPLVRRTLTDYLTTNLVNGADYTATSIHLRGLPSQTSVYDGNGIEQARTKFEYDNYGAVDYHAAIVTYPRAGFSELPISGLDPAFNSTSVNLARGNVTKTTRYLLNDTGNVIGSISGYEQYDVAGNVVRTIDPRSTPTNMITTTFDFSDRFGAPDGEALSNSGSTELNDAGQNSYAFPTKVTNAAGHIFYSQFEYYLGRPVDTQDANGVVTSGYSDVNEMLDRPKRVIRAVNGGADVKSQITFIYNDAAHTITTTSDQNTFNDNALKKEIVYDGLGRTVETRQYENSTQYITVKQVPFVALQDPDTNAWVSASQTSNPFRAGEPVWTTSFADALGRTTKVRTPDNAIVKTTYSGNSVTVSDQAGRQRKSVSDALDRLKEVYEAPNDTANFNYLTSYDYDALGNLRHVYQGSQTRTFEYDSLSRLRTAMNPESGTTRYEYDVNGNLTQKIDARSVITTFAPYDLLNRPTTKSYSDGTPTVSYAYDAGGVENSKGMLTSISSSVSTYNYGSYDALGRPKTGSQVIGSQTYLIAYSYDLAGHVKTINYPSGHAVSYNYDGAGRLGDKDAQNLAFTGDLGGTPLQYSTGITYSPFGGLSQERFGTATPIYNKLLYNIRGQLGEIRPGFTPNNTSWELGAIINHYSKYYECWGASCNAADNNGNLMSQDHWIQDGDNHVRAIFKQDYEYDKVNRLKSVVGVGAGWQQAYTYDRYGNRRINGDETSGENINNMQAAVVANTGTNRLYAPGETETNHPLMNYDPAGNQTRDYFSDPVVDYDRTYDAENRMKSATATTGQTNAYSYDADGRRVIRNVNGEVTWQVYGFGGELLAEYAANDPYSSPKKEYGYRNGQLLITAIVTTAGGSAPVLDDNPLVLNQTTVQARHITQLRVAINSLRSQRGTPAYSWQTSATTSDWISANPILEMRTALDQTLGAPSDGYSIGLTQYQPVKAIHIQELRNRVLAAWNSGGGGVDIRWLVSDQLGTPRIVIDQSGSLATVSRHDYLPFGEELFAGTAGRTPDLGYTNSDSARQKFTAKERDIETNLDYFLARYYSPTQGRFTSPDEFRGGPDELFILGSGDGQKQALPYADAFQPQSLNKYQYCYNNPLRYVDPDGHDVWEDLKQGFIGGAKVVANIFIEGSPLIAAPNGISKILTGKPIVRPFDASNNAQRAGMTSATVASVFLPMPGGKTKALGQAAVEGELAVSKAVNSELMHAAGRAVERGFFDSVKEATGALRALSKDITKNGLPEGTIVDRAHADRVLVPLKDGAYAVYQLGKNGTAKLKTVLTREAGK